MASQQTSLVQFVDWYGSQLGARPYFTNSVSAAFVGAFSTILRHCLVNGKGIPNPRDVLNQIILGFCVCAPLGTTWFGNLEKVFKGWDAGSMQTVLAKTAMEQTFFGPTMNTCFMAGIGLLEGRSPNEIRKDIVGKFFDIMLGNMFFWGPSALFSYKFVPPKFRTLWSRIMGIFWMLYLISKTSQSGKAKSIEQIKKFDMQDGKRVGA